MGQTGSVYMNGATSLLLIENGSTLDADNGVYLNEGKLATIPVNQANQPEAKIIGNLTNAGADVVISDPAYDPFGGGHKFAVLKIEGDAIWSGGVFRIFTRLNLNGTTVSDRWVATGEFTITTGALGAKLGPAGIENPGNYDLTNVTWEKIIEAPTITFDPDPEEVSIDFEVASQEDDWTNLEAFAPIGENERINLTHD
jgi:hypothetical protein